jgi:hypothetical protein
LILTACDPFPPAVGRAADVFPDDAPLLFPENVCQPPPFEDDADPGDVPRLTADVLPDDVDDGDGFTRCHPPLLLPAPAVRAAELAGPALARAAAALPMLFADLASACLC